MIDSHRRPSSHHPGPVDRLVYTPPPPDFSARAIVVFSAQLRPSLRHLRLLHATAAECIFKTFSAVSPKFAAQEVQFSSKIARTEERLAVQQDMLEQLFRERHPPP